MAKRSNDSWPKLCFVLPDQHYAPVGDKEGGVDKRAESCAMQAIEIVKPDIYVNIGDVGEWSSVSHWRYKKIKRPPLRYQLDELVRDAEAVNAGLDEHDAALKLAGCKEKHMIQGNHDAWVDNFIEEYPQLAKDYSFASLTRMKERGYIFHPYGDAQYASIGKLYFYHGGHWTVKYHAHRHVEALGCSIMYGHYHDQQTAKVPTLGGYHGAWSIGCICNTTKRFMKGRPTNWSHNFAIVHFEKDGTFHVEVVEIYEGKCYLWGKRITA